MPYSPYSSSMTVVARSDPVRLQFRVCKWMIQCDGTWLVEDETLFSRNTDKDFITVLILFSSSICTVLFLFRSRPDDFNGSYTIDSHRKIFY